MMKNLRQKFKNFKLIQMSNIVSIKVTSYLLLFFHAITLFVFLTVDKISQRSFCTVLVIKPGDDILVNGYFRLSSQNDPQTHSGHKRVSMMNA